MNGLDAALADLDRAGLADRYYNELVAREDAEARRAAETFRGTREVEWDDLFSEPMHWLVQGLLPHGGTAFLVGKPNMGKTFVYLDMACHVALGRSWLGKATTSARVLFVLGEGLAGFGDRVSAWADANGVSLDDLRGRLTFIDGANINNDISLERIAEVANRDEVDLIIFDTYAASSGVQSEDDAALNARTLNRANTIRPGATLLFVHHPTKSSEDSIAPVLRGSGALAGAAEVVMTLWNDPKHMPTSGLIPDGAFLALSTENSHGGKNRHARTETVRGLYLTGHGGSAVVQHDSTPSAMDPTVLVREHLTEPMTVQTFMDRAGLKGNTSRVAEKYLKNNPAVRVTPARGPNPAMYELAA